MPRRSYPRCAVVDLTRILPYGPCLSDPTTTHPVDNTGLLDNESFFKCTGCTVHLENRCSSWKPKPILKTDVCSSTRNVLFPRDEWELEARYHVLWILKESPEGYIENGFHLQARRSYTSKSLIHSSSSQNTTPIQHANTRTLNFTSAPYQSPIFSYDIPQSLSSRALP